jgi:hypothetical protein
MSLGACENGFDARCTAGFCFFVLWTARLLRLAVVDTALSAGGVDDEVVGTGEGGGGGAGSGLGSGEDVADCADAAVVVVDPAAAAKEAR